MRRNVLGVLLLVLILVAGTISASAISKTIKLNLFDNGYYSLAGSVPFAADYETQIGSNTSFVVGGSVGALGILGANAGIRYYLQPGLMQGIYAEGRVNALTAFLFGGGVGIVGAGGTGGYKYVFDNGFTLDGGVGIATPIFVFAAGGGDFAGGFAVQPTIDIRLGLGYSW